MGYIALEMVEALHARGIQVDMVKPRPTFIPWMNLEMANQVQMEIERHGVKMHLGQDIKGIETSGEGLRVPCSDVTLEGRMVLVAVGVRPNSGLAAEPSDRGG